MGEIHVHEFMTLDGVIDAPSWTFDYGFDPKMAEVLAEVTAKARGSGTLTDTTWRNSQIVGPYEAGTIRRLKDEVDGNLYVSGSAMLVRAMLADGLVDGLHLFVYPLTLGSGPRLFAEGDAAKFSLAACESYANGVVYSAYRPQA